MKIFNYIKDEVCIPIVANDIKEAHDAFFEAEGYRIKVETIKVEDKNQLDLFEEKKEEPI